MSVTVQRPMLGLFDEQRMSLEEAILITERLCQRSDGGVFAALWQSV